MKNRGFWSGLMIGLAGFSVMGWSFSLSARANLETYVDGIVAVVENRVITVSMIVRETFEHEMRLARQLPAEEYQRRAHQLRSEVLDSLIDNHLLLAEFEDRGYQLPEAYVTRQVNEVIRRETGGDRAEFEGRLQEQGLSLSEFREQVRRNMIVELLLDEEVRRRGEVPEAEVRRFYRENRIQFTLPEEVRVQKIFLSRQGRSEAQLRARVEEVAERLARGDDFELLGLEFSDHPESLALTWVDFGDLAPPLAAMAQRLPLHEVSPPVVAEDGVYMLRIQEKQGEATAEFAEVRETVREILSRRRQAERYDRFIASLRRKFRVKIHE